MHMRRYWWYAGSNPNPNRNPDPNPDLAHEEVLVVGGVCVEVADDLEGARAHRAARRQVGRLRALPPLRLAQLVGAALRSCTARGPRRATAAGRAA